MHERPKKTPKILTLQVAKEKEKEEEKLSLTTLHPSLNLLTNNLSFKKIPNLHFEQSLEQGKKFGVRRQSKSQWEILRTE
jgi:hypothetical protein